MRKKVIEQYEVEEPPAGDTAGDTAQPKPGAQGEALSAFMERMGGSGAKATIYKYPKGPGGGEREWCMTAPVEEVDEQFLYDNFGSGKYLIRIFDNEGKYANSIPVSIADRARTPGAAPGGQDAYSAQVNLLREQMASNQQLLLAMIQNRPQQQQTVAELVGALKGLYDMSKPADPGAGIKTVIDSLVKGIELAQATGGGDDKMSWVRVIEHVADKIPALKTLGQNAETASGVPATTAATAGGIPATATAPPAASPANGDQGKMFLRQYIGYLKKKALMRQDPGLWVDFITSNLDEQHWYQLVQLLQQPFDRISEVDPEIANEPLRSWFEALFMGLKDALQHVAPASTDQGSNPDDTPGNASSGR